MTEVPAPGYIPGFTFSLADCVLSCAGSSLVAREDMKAGMGSIDRLRGSETEPDFHVVHPTVVPDPKFYKHKMIPVPL